MDTMAVVYARELTRRGIETSITFRAPSRAARTTSLMPDKERVAEYEASPDKGFRGRCTQRFRPIVPPDANVAGVADAIVKVVDAVFGKRPIRVYPDPPQDRAEG